MYINRPLEEYLDDLAAKKPTPGGGSVAALTASLGTCLMSMAANFTIGKPEYKDVECKIADLLLQVQKHDSELRSLIDADIDAYKKLLAALKDNSLGSAELDEFYKLALESPYLVCEITNKCIKLCRDLAEFGNKNLITDTAIAVTLFDAAFVAARYNVYVNLKNISDTDYIAKVHHILAPIEEEMPKLKEEILEMCEDIISS